jgi:glycerophosphoryl diester phosphodiesterase
VQGRPEVRVFVEIKRASLTRFGHEQVLARVLQTLRPAHAQCVVISFDLAAVRSARELGGMPIGWVIPQYDAHSRLECEALQPQFLFCDHEQLPPSGALWRGPWQWAVYEVESLPLALSLSERGALYIETMAVNEMSTAMHALDAGAHAPRRGA